MNFTITKPNFLPSDIARIDPRFLPFLKGWSVIETYSGKTVTIPDIVPFNYYQVTDKPANDLQDNEMQLSLWCGWAGRSNGKDIDGLYDAEVIINLRIQGTDVLDPTKKNVAAEILKSGGAPMQVFFNGHMMTDFSEYITVAVPSSGWFCPAKTIPTKVTNGYQTISNMYQYV